MSPPAEKQQKRHIDPVTAAMAYAALRGGEAAARFPMLKMLDIGALPEDAPRSKVKERGREHSRARRYFGREYETKPKKQRQAPGFESSGAYALPEQNLIAVSPRAPTSIMAHELGHISNYLQGQKSVPGRAHQALTSASYAPIYPASSIAGSAGYAFQDPSTTGLEDPMEMLGHSGTAGAGILGALQLLEEGRASLKARKALKEIKGPEYSYKDVAPLAGGFGTYALGAGSAVGLPLLIHHLTGS